MPGPSIGKASGLSLDDPEASNAKLSGKLPERKKKKKMDIPEGLSMQDEHDAVRKLQWRETKDTIISWLQHLVPEWKVKCDLTYAKCNVAPEQVEKRVRWWLRKVAPGCTAICGIEYQTRGSAHAHVIVDQRIDFKTARELWQEGAGFCWLQAVRNSPRAIGYAIKDAVKRGEVNIYGPAVTCGPATAREFSTDAKHKNHQRPQKADMSPEQYEAEALAALATNQVNAPLRAEVADRSGTVNPLPEGRRREDQRGVLVEKIGKRRRG